MPVLDFDKLIGTRVGLRYPIPHEGVTYTEGVVSHCDLVRGTWHLQLRPRRFGYQDVTEIDVHGVGHRVQIQVDEAELRYSIPLKWTMDDRSWAYYFTGLPWKKTPMEGMAEALSASLADADRAKWRAERSGPG